jgi:hypothetical protein
MNTVLLILAIVWSVGILYLVYQFFRNDAVYNIRINWIDTNDPRLDQYTYDEMMSPSWSNFYGFRFPKARHFKLKD